MSLDLIDLDFLIGCLNPLCRAAVERATTAAAARGHAEVGLEHLLLALVDAPNSDAVKILGAFSVDLAIFKRDLNRALANAALSHADKPRYSAALKEILESAWTIASTEFKIDSIRSGTLVLAAIEKGFPALVGLRAAAVRQAWTGLLDSDEAHTPEPDSALDQYTVDLTAAARAGTLDPVFGRQAEIRQVISVLMRRRQNNPILIGEPGVGKTAIVEGLAQRIAEGDAPPALLHCSLRSLDLSLLLAGASMRGEFEARLKSVVSAVQSQPGRIILFIDEAHTLMGGQGEAANLLKPALARGNLRTIAATTHAEYRKYFEKDAALARRFQVVQVEEPSEEQAIQMMRPLVALLERHHAVRLLDEALEAAVRLSRRYLPGRQLPDKAVSLLDTACARVAAAQNAIPPAIEEGRHAILVIEDEVKALERDHTGGTFHEVTHLATHEARLAQLFDKLAATEMQLADLEDRWKEEKSLVQELTRLRDRLEPDQLEQVNAQLSALQGDSPLVPAHVDARVIAQAIGDLTGIPVGRMLRNEIHTVLTLRNILEERVVGQSHAIETIVRRISSARAGVEDPYRPTGVFLLTGPSAVGKTETALALADALYGGERNAVILNMSEFQEPHSVSSLKGAPPGYVGYGEGGVLTEAVRRRPYCVLLLDEIEKAHADVLELFYQVFDKGALEDAKGRPVDFRNALILMTSNVGSDSIERMCPEGREWPSPERLRQVLDAELRDAFKPAFLSRLVVVPYYPLKKPGLRHIVELKIDKLRTRLEHAHRIDLQCSEALIDAVTERALDTGNGARGIDEILTGTIMPEISERILRAMADRRAIGIVSADAAGPGAFRYQIG